VLRSVPQLLLMSAIVTTALFAPVAALVALLAMLLGVPLQSLVTFGGSLGTLQGMAAWWLIFFVPALVYAAYVMPWRATET